MKIKKLRKAKDIILYLSENNIKISFYKLKKMYLEKEISGLHLNNNFYFYLDEIKEYFNLWAMEL